MKVANLLLEQELEHREEQQTSSLMSLVSHELSGAFNLCF
jgi:hypothetical protein